MSGASTLAVATHSSECLLLNSNTHRAPFTADSILKPINKQLAHTTIINRPRIDNNEESRVSGQLRSGRFGLNEPCAIA